MGYCFLYLLLVGCAMPLCLQHSIHATAKHPSRVQAMEASKCLSLIQLIEPPCAVYQPISWIRFCYQILTCIVLCHVPMPPPQHTRHRETSQSSAGYGSEQMPQPHPAHRTAMCRIPAHQLDSFLLPDTYL